jgi:ATP-grasp domain/L-amino acid ligase C-terminal domain 2
MLIGHDGWRLGRSFKMESVRRLLLFAATTGYQIRVFAEAGRKLGISVTLATDRCHVLDDPWGDAALPVKFDRIEESVESLRGMAFDGVAAVGDRPSVLASEVAEMLEIPFHPPAAARAASDKYLARQLNRAAGVRVPSFFCAATDRDPEGTAIRAPYPCVLKPLGFSASRGVIRANNQAEFVDAFYRIRKMGESHLQVESYIEGREFAVEGLVTRGCFQPLAIFDKPDPLEGPYFEETIYVTPSRETAAVQRELLEATEQSIRALGLYHGPIHAELRYNRQGAWILETAPRPIGGLCSRALQFELNGKKPAPLEEVILRHALGEDVNGAQLAAAASGVMMIPIPKAGVFESVEGTEGALGVEGIEDLIIAAKPGQLLLPLPEGASYLGFLFARGQTAEAVESAIREAQAKLRFRIATALEVFPPNA